MIDKIDLEKIVHNKIKKIMLDESNRLVSSAISVIDREKINNSYSLRQSFSTRIVNNVIYLYSNYYFNYIDKGVSGVKKKRNSKYSFKNKKPPIEMIKRYLRNKGDYITNPYKLRNVIYYYGINGKNLTEKIKNEYLKKKYK